MPRDGVERDAVMADEGTTAEEVENVNDTEEGTDVEESVTDAATDDASEDEVLTKEDFDNLKKSLAVEAEEKKKILGAHQRERQARRDLEKRLKDIERQSEDDTAKSRREAEEAALSKYKPIVAKSALLEAKARTDRAGALVKLINMDALEFDGNEEVQGLDLEVQRLQDEYPEFFIQEAAQEEKPAPRPAPKAATAPKKPAKTEERSAGERIAAQLLGTR
jgi:hypothetical protein